MNRCFCRVFAFIFILWTSLYCAPDKAVTSDCAGESLFFSLSLISWQTNWFFVWYCFLLCFILFFFSFFARWRWCDAVFVVAAAVFAVAIRLFLLYFVLVSALRKCSNVPPAESVQRHYTKQVREKCICVYYVLCNAMPLSVVFFTWD